MAKTKSAGNIVDTKYNYFMSYQPKKKNVFVIIFIKFNAIFWSEGLSVLLSKFNTRTTDNGIYFYYLNIYYIYRTN